MMVYKQKGEKMSKRNDLSCVGVRNNNIPNRSKKRGFLAIPHRPEKQITVIPAGKPPKLRFHPGEFLRFEEELYEIIYAYRMAEKPHEWLFCLEERKSLRSVEPDDHLGRALVGMGLGESTPRLIYDIFRNSLDVLEYFGDIPSHGHRRILSTKDLLQKKAKVVSSGEIIDT